MTEPTTKDMVLQELKTTRFSNKDSVQDLADFFKEYRDDVKTVYISSNYANEVSGYHPIIEYKTPDMLDVFHEILEDDTVDKREKIHLLRIIERSRPDSNSNQQSSRINNMRCDSFFIALQDKNSDVAEAAMERINWQFFLEPRCVYRDYCGLSTYTKEEILKGARLSNPDTIHEWQEMRLYKENSYFYNNPSFFQMAEKAIKNVETPEAAQRYLSVLNKALELPGIAAVRLTETLSRQDSIFKGYLPDLMKDFQETVAYCTQFEKTAFIAMEHANHAIASEGRSLMSKMPKVSNPSRLTTHITATLTPDEQGQHKYSAKEQAQAINLALVAIRSNKNHKIVVDEILSLARMSKDMTVLKSSENVQHEINKYILKGIDENRISLIRPNNFDPYDIMHSPGPSCW